eukprot:7117888-Lingulodinium_polyedra.AAC.1
MRAASMTLAANAHDSASAANARAAEAMEAVGVSARAASEIDHERRRLEVEREQRKLSPARKDSQVQNVSQQFQ